MGVASEKGAGRTATLPKANRRKEKGENILLFQCSPFSFLLLALGSIAARHGFSTSQNLTVDPKAEQRCR
jgi:hypothetical protein